MRGQLTKTEQMIKDELEYQAKHEELPLAYHLEGKGPRLVPRNGLACDPYGFKVLGRFLLPWQKIGLET